MSERPSVHTTWAPKGKTPLIKSSGSWKKLSLSGVIITDPAGKKSRLFLRSLTGNMNKEEAVRFLKDLKRHMRGRKLLLVWDGLPAHRAQMVRDYIASQSSWLKTARFPGYAPELNPIEYLWATMKKRYLGNLADLTEIGTALRNCRRKIGDAEVLGGFLKASGLFG